MTTYYWRYLGEGQIPNPGRTYSFVTFRREVLDAFPGTPESIAARINASAVGLLAEIEHLASSLGDHVCIQIRTVMDWAPVPDGWTMRVAVYLASGRPDDENGWCIKESFPLVHHPVTTVRISPAWSTDPSGRGTARIAQMAGSALRWMQ